MPAFLSSFVKKKKAGVEEGVGREMSLRGKEKTVAGEKGKFGLGKEGESIDFDTIEKNLRRFEELYDIWRSGGGSGSLFSCSLILSPYLRLLSTLHITLQLLQCLQTKTTKSPENKRKGKES